MGSLPARTIEALAGASLGGLSLAGVGALTHKTKTPTEWLGDDDKVHARKLTKQEKLDRNKRIRNFAALGLGLGASGSVLSSAARRAILSSAEKGLLPKVVDERLSGLKKIVQDRTREAEKASIFTGTAEKERRVLRAEKARKLLSEQERKISDLASAASIARSETPWGGIRLRGGGKTQVPHEKLTLEGQVERYYRDLQKEQNLPPMISPYDRGAIGEEFFKKLLEKTSVSRALIEELQSIEKHAALSTSMWRRVSDATQNLMSRVPFTSAANIRANREIASQRLARFGMGQQPISPTSVVDTGRPINSYGVTLAARKAQRSSPVPSQRGNLYKPTPSNLYQTQQVPMQPAAMPKAPVAQKVEPVQPTPPAPKVDSPQQRAQAPGSPTSPTSNPSWPDFNAAAQRAQGWYGGLTDAQRAALAAGTVGAVGLGGLATGAVLG